MTFTQQCSHICYTLYSLNSPSSLGSLRLQSSLPSYQFGAPLPSILHTVAWFA